MRDGAPTTISARLLWRYLTIVAALFVSIFVPLLGGFEWAGSRLGATVPLSTIARAQQDDRKLLWLGGFKDYAPYKLENQACPSLRFYWSGAHVVDRRESSSSGLTRPTTPVSPHGRWTMWSIS